MFCVFVDELDSYMYQSVGHHAIDLYSEAIGVPLYRREIQGTSVATSMDYLPTVSDEVEDLYELLKTVKVIESKKIQIYSLLNDLPQQTITTLIDIYFESRTKQSM